ncbi:hypothetical protein KSF78_0005204 [Schistosoma japonicum]|nr:hypothetical protein KSF78_0005204 [Schistosoma japonicum]
MEDVEIIVTENQADTYSFLQANFLPCPKGFTCSSSNSGVRSRRIKHQFQHSGPVIKCEFTVSYIW